MWDLVPWPGIEPRPPALEARSLIGHWTTREIPPRWLLIEDQPYRCWCSHFSKSARMAGAIAGGSLFHPWRSPHPPLSSHSRISCHLHPPFLTLTLSLLSPPPSLCWPHFLCALQCLVCILLQTILHSFFQRGHYFDPVLLTHKFLYSPLWAAGSLFLRHSVTSRLVSNTDVIFIYSGHSLYFQKAWGIFLNVIQNKDSSPWKRTRSNEQKLPKTS